MKMLPARLVLIARSELFVGQRVKWRHNRSSSILKIDLVRGPVGDWVFEGCSTVDELNFLPCSFLVYRILMLLFAIVMLFFYLITYLGTVLMLSETSKISGQKLFSPFSVGSASEHMHSHTAFILWILCVFAKKEADPAERTQSKKC